MNVLETILNFLTRLARIIFPRKQRPAAGDCPCPHPLPAPAEPPLPPDEGNGSDPDLHRGDTLALAQGDWGNRQKAAQLQISVTYFCSIGLYFLV